MKQENVKKIIAMGIIGLAGFAGLGAVSAFNENTNPNQTGNHNGLFGGRQMHGQGGGHFGRANMLMQNEDIQSAIESNNYNAFVTALESADNDRIPTSEQFAQIVERTQMHTAVKNAIELNDYDAFVDAHVEIEGKTVPSLDQFNEMVERHKSHEAIELAIENNDYNAWATAVSNTPFGSEITEIISQDDFNEFIQMHEAKESGDYNTAKIIAEELGLDDIKELGRGKIRGFGTFQSDNNKRMHKGMHNQNIEQNTVTE